MNRKRKCVSFVSAAPVVFRGTSPCESRTVGEAVSLAVGSHAHVDNLGREVGISEIHRTNIGLCLRLLSIVHLCGPWVPAPCRLLSLFWTASSLSPLITEPEPEPGSGTELGITSGLV